MNQPVFISLFFHCYILAQYSFKFLKMTNIFDSKILKDFLKLVNLKENNVLILVTFIENNPKFKYGLFTN